MEQVRRRRRYYIKEGGLLDILLKILAVVGWVIAMSLPSTIENLMGWL